MPTAPTAPSAQIANPVPGRPHRWRHRRLTHRRRGAQPFPRVAAAWLLVVIVVSLAAPLLTPHDPLTQSLDVSLRPPGLGETTHGVFLLGTDNLGRDELSRLLYGVRPMVEVAVLSVVIGGVIGLVLGLTAAMSSRPVEFLLMRLADIQLSIPLFVLAILLAFTLRPGLSSSVIAIVVATWPYYARLVRADVAAVRSSAYVQLARVAGRRGLPLVYRHVLPNALGSFVALCVLNLGVAVTIAAALSFLGVGVQPPTAEWGNMIASGTQYLGQWWLVTIPGVALCTVVIALNSVGNYVRHRLGSGESRAAGLSVARAVDTAPDAASGSAQPAGSTEPSSGHGEGAIVSLDGLVVVNQQSEPVVRDVSMALRPGRVMGIIGESGSGKSTVCRAIASLLPTGLRPTAGTVECRGRRYTVGDTEALRGGEIGMVFQDPLSSLNPLLRVGYQLGETRRIHRLEGRGTVRDWVRRALVQLDFRDPAAIARMHPHQLSGGMRQRVCVGIASSGEPGLVLADEPTTALDVSLQGKVLRLLLEQCREQQAALVLVSHDVRVVRDTCDEVTVLYGGRMLEQGPAESVLGQPRSPYTKGLLDSSPRLDPETLGRRLNFIPPLQAGDTVGDGCPFAGRCSREISSCRDHFPDARTAPDGAVVWCWNPVDANEVSSVG